MFPQFQSQKHISSFSANTNLSSQDSSGSNHLLGRTRQHGCSHSAPDTPAHRCRPDNSKSHFYTFKSPIAPPFPSQKKESPLPQLKQRLTGQDSSQCCPLHPGEHVQIPSIGSHAAPFAHKHVWLQSSPHVPLEQGMEQSIPCQP